MGIADMDKLEREAFRKFHEDGLFDIYLGLLLAAVPLAGIFESILPSETVILLVYAVVVTTIVGIYALLRRKVVRPRLGTFTPAPQRKRKISLVRLALAASVVLGLLVWWAFAAAAGSTPCGRSCRSSGSSTRYSCSGRWRTSLMCRGSTSTASSSAYR